MSATVAPPARRAPPVTSSPASLPLSAGRGLGLTERQRDALAFIVTFIAARRRSPTLVEICDGLSLSAKSGANRLVAALIERGHARRDAFGRLVPTADVPSLILPASLNGEPLKFIPVHGGRVG